MSPKTCIAWRRPLAGPGGKQARCDFSTRQAGLMIGKAVLGEAAIIKVPVGEAAIGKALLGRTRLGEATAGETTFSGASVRSRGDARRVPRVERA